MNPFTGAGVALVTPFNQDGSIDELSLRRLVDYVIEGGVDFITALGTTAETPTLSMSEREAVFTIIHSQVNKRVPILVGIGGYDTLFLVEQLKKEEWLKKADGILSVTPYYNKPSQEGLITHFTMVAEVAPVPIILYNVPGRTGVNLNADTVRILAERCPNIIGVKEAAGGCIHQASRLMNINRPDFAFLSGDDSAILPLMALGFQGGISVLGNVAPRQYADLVRAMKEADLIKARGIHQELLPLCEALFLEGNPAGIKAALHAKGVIDNNVLRLPLMPASDGLYQKISTILG